LANQLVGNVVVVVQRWSQDTVVSCPDLNHHCSWFLLLPDQMTSETAAVAAVAAVAVAVVVVVVVVAVPIVVGGSPCVKYGPDGSDVQWVHSLEPVLEVGVASCS
jgi:hypothetical protein